MASTRMSKSPKTQHQAKAAPKKAAPKKAAPKKAAPKKAAPKKAAPKKAAPKKAAPRHSPKVSPNRDKTLAWYLDTLPARQRGVAEVLVALVEKAAPKATVAIKWSRPVWAHRGPFCWLKESKAHVAFGFWRGTELTSPAAGLLVGTGNKMRHIKLRDGEPLPVKALTSLIREASGLNDKLGDPTRGKAG